MTGGKIFHKGQKTRVQFISRRRKISEIMMHNDELTMQLDKGGDFWCPDTQIFEQGASCNSMAT